jgi:hypothetical protein
MYWLLIVFSVVYAWWAGRALILGPLPFVLQE